MPSDTGRRRARPSRRTAPVTDTVAIEPPAPPEPSAVDPEPGSVETTERSDDRVFPTRWPRLGLQSLSVAVVAWVYAALLYRIWDASLKVPLDDTAATPT